jgi:hypothetical protein
MFGFLDINCTPKAMRGKVRLDLGIKSRSCYDKIQMKKRGILSRMERLGFEIFIAWPER